MKSLYTISPTILSDKLPEKNSIESIISEYFHLFNIYSDNLYIVKDYMNFVDINFNHAFYKLKYEIIEYEYPDNLEAMTDIIAYINNKYKLVQQTELSIYYRVNCYTINDIFTGIPCNIYLNDYALYDSRFMDINLYNTDLLYNLDMLVGYLNDINDRGLMKRLIQLVTIYDSAVSDVMNDIPDVFTSGMVSEPLLALSHLRTFIYNTLRERSAIHG